MNFSTAKSSIIVTHRAGTRLLIRLGISLLMLASQINAIAADIQLPLLSDSSSGIISKQQEYIMGRTWLKAFRSHIDEYDDPLLQDYLEQLLYNLATHSDLQDPQLELIIVNNPSMNAFAVPGGVVGIHTGVFALAEHEDQMVSILAHELAHLSQRHFARGLETQRKASLLNMAGLLTSLVLAATSGGDAGMAAITATQAVAMDRQLRYSRSNEQEADRMGLQTMQRANRNPDAAAEMFEILLKTNRYKGDRLPEFLLTHPITEKRIADARNRTLDLPIRHYRENPKFFLMRTRVQVMLKSNVTEAIRYFEGQLAANTQHAQAAHYGLALCYIKSADYLSAHRILESLLANNPQEQIFHYTTVELDIAQQRYDQALIKLDRLLNINPDSYPLNSLKSAVLWQAHRYEEAAQILTLLSRERAEDPMIWYKLAEVRGLAGDISGVHQARAEYFILVGAFDRARKQLGLAIRLLAADFKRSAIIQQRLREIASMEERIEKL